MTLQASILMATLLEVEEIQLVPVGTGQYGMAATAAPAGILASTWQLDYVTQQDFIYRAVLHDLINTVMPAPGYW